MRQDFFALVFVNAPPLCNPVPDGLPWCGWHDDSSPNVYVRFELCKPGWELAKHLLAFDRPAGSKIVAAPCVVSPLRVAGQGSAKVRDYNHCHIVPKPLVLLSQFTFKIKTKIVSIK